MKNLEIFQSFTLIWKCGFAGNSEQLESCKVAVPRIPLEFLFYLFLVKQGSFYLMKDVRGEKDKYVFQREHRLLQRQNKQQ